MLSLRRVIRDDYLLRQIQQFAEVLARIAGKREAGEHERAIAEVGRVWDDLLGVRRELVDVLDMPSLAALLREPERIGLAAQLLVEEALALEARGDPGAVTVRRRADELAALARDRS